MEASVFSTVPPGGSEHRTPSKITKNSDLMLELQCLVLPPLVTVTKVPSKRDQSKWIWDTFHHCVLLSWTVSGQDWNCSGGLSRRLTCINQTLKWGDTANTKSCTVYVWRHPQYTYTPYMHGRTHHCRPLHRSGVNPPEQWQRKVPGWLV